MDKKIIVEISGICNAKCPWCFTGKRNRFGGSYPARFMTTQDFGNVMDRLKAIGLMGEGSLIELFNWGEPLLNPNFVNIVKVMNEYNVGFRISTNASRVVDVPGNLMVNLQELVISMSGFSQNSYNKVHGFKFEKILENINSIVKNFKSSGFHGRLILSYHVYQFNIHEVPWAVEYCRKNNFEFFPYLANVVDFDDALAYLKGELSEKMLTRMSKELLLFTVDPLIASTPEDYHCFQQDKMVIDEYGNVLTCCLVPKSNPDYAIGSIFRMSLDEIKQKKKKRRVCADCMKYGLSYWLLHPVKPPFLT